MVDEKQITQELLAFGRSIASEELFPTVVKEAAPLIANELVCICDCLLP